MLDQYARLFLDHPLLEAALKPLLEEHQELSDDTDFLCAVFAIVEIRPAAFTKSLCASEPNEPCVRQMELFLGEREETENIFPWIVAYQNSQTSKSDNLAVAYHRPEMIRLAVGFLHRCALRIMEDCRAEIGRKARTKHAFDGHKLK
jgi:hypothetical protein